MAKRYIRINWQNAPSVATPRNAENLNIMDKGIDDLDLYKIDTDAIANNLVTTEAGLVLDARQGKVLDDKVNTINNNLTSKIGTVLTGSVFDITTSGIWYCGVGVTNKPTEIPGMLFVAYGSVNNIVYIYIPNIAGAFLIYKCVVESGVRSGWVSK